jgi:hypothetical protein
MDTFSDALAHGQMELRYMQQLREQIDELSAIMLESKHAEANDCTD